jgi:hypothetical protein
VVAPSADVARAERARAIERARERQREIEIEIERERERERERDRARAREREFIRSGRTLISLPLSLSWEGGGSCVVVMDTGCRGVATVLQGDGETESV